MLGRTSLLFMFITFLVSFYFDDYVIQLYDYVEVTKLILCRKLFQFFHSSHSMELQTQEIKNRGSGIRICWVTVCRKLICGGGVYVELNSRRCTL